MVKTVKVKAHERKNDTKKNKFTIKLDASSEDAYGMCWGEGTVIKNGKEYSFVFQSGGDGFQLNDANDFTEDEWLFLEETIGNMIVDREGVSWTGTVDNKKR